MQLDHKPLATRPLSGQLPLAAHVEIQTHFWEHGLGVIDGTAQSMLKRALVCYIYCDLKHTDKLSLKKKFGTHQAPVPPEDSPSAGPHLPQKETSTWVGTYFFLHNSCLILPCGTTVPWVKLWEVSA